MKETETKLETMMTNLNRKQISDRAVKAHAEIKTAAEQMGFSAGLTSRLQCDLYDGKYPFELAYLETAQDTRTIENILVLA